VTSVRDKRIVISGGSSGIGFETARALCARGARVCLIVRSRERGEAAAARIAEETGNPPDLVLGDLSEKDSTASAAAELLSRYPRIDVLINNAGAYFDERRETSDGLEMTFALNHMSYFRLSTALLERIKVSAPARIINVSSAAHRRARLDFDDLQHSGQYRGFMVYSESKLANIYFTRALARRLEGSRVTVNALHPGFVKSGFGSNNSGFRPGPFVLKLLASLIAVTPEKGAETSIFLAESPEVEGVTGAYFSGCRQVGPSPRALDDEAAERLWRISEELA
jgi:retinol dehydrogenase 12